MRTPHYQRVLSLMEQAGQATPNVPTVPDEATRLLRAKLIFEEAIRELLYEGLGVSIRIKGYPESINGPRAKAQDLIVFETYDGKTKLEPNLTLIADGCIDTSVVTIGTLIACGIDDKELLELVDNNNLAKFGPPKCNTCGKEMASIGVDSDTSSKPMYRCRQHFIGIDTCPDTIVTGGYRNEAGKWIKPSNHRPPDIAAELERQTKEKTAYLNYLKNDILSPEEALNLAKKHLPDELKSLASDELGKKFIGFDEAESVDSAAFESLANNPHIRRKIISSPMPDPNAFYKPALRPEPVWNIENIDSQGKPLPPEDYVADNPPVGERHVISKRLDPAWVQRDLRIGKRCTYDVMDRGVHCTKGIIVGSGDIAPISKPATGEEYLVINDDHHRNTLWIEVSKVTIID